MDVGAVSAIASGCNPWRPRWHNATRNPVSVTVPRHNVLTLPLAQEPVSVAASGYLQSAKSLLVMRP